MKEVERERWPSGGVVGGKEEEKARRKKWWRWKKRRRKKNKTVLMRRACGHLMFILWGKRGVRSTPDNNKIHKLEFQDAENKG